MPSVPPVWLFRPAQGLPRSESAWNVAAVVPVIAVEMSLLPTGRTSKRSPSAPGVESRALPSTTVPVAATLPSAAA